MQATKTARQVLTLGLLGACSKTPIEHFEQSNAGKALETCAKNKGELRITDLTEVDGKEIVGVVLKKFERELTFQFQLTPPSTTPESLACGLPGTINLIV